MSLETSPIVGGLAEKDPEISIRNPRTGGLLPPLACTSEIELRDVVAQAKSASRDWVSTNPTDWAAALQRAADQIEVHADELAELNARETGRAVDEAKAGIEAGISTLRQYAELGPTHRGHRLRGAAATLA